MLSFKIISGLSVRLSVCLSIWMSVCAKSIKSHYQSKVFVCVRVISGHMQTIAKMWLIGF